MLRAVRGPGGGSSWNLAFCGPKNVLQRLQNIKCFWKKNPINFRVQISPRVKTMHNAWIFPPISSLNISVYRLQPRLFIDSPPYLRKNQKNQKELRFRSYAWPSHCYQSLNFSKFFCWLCPFLFHNILACVFFLLYYQ